MPIPDTCTLANRCHGALKWCDNCGDVKHVCDMRLRGDKCYSHPVPPEWSDLHASRAAAERMIKAGEKMQRDGRDALEEVADAERARRAFDLQQRGEEEGFWKVVSS